MNPKGQEKIIHAMNFIEPILCKEQGGPTLSDISKENYYWKSIYKVLKLLSKCVNFYADFDKWSI